jgi:hypothetical protein
MGAKNPPMVLFTPSNRHRFVIHKVRLHTQGIVPKEERKTRWCSLAGWDIRLLRKQSVYGRKREGDNFMSPYFQLAHVPPILAKRKEATADALNGLEKY